MEPAVQSPPLSTQPPPPPAVTGTVLLGKYQLGRILGRGSFAKVHEAWSVETGAVMAIKQIDKKRTADANVPDSMIVSEIAAMRRLRHHPNIIEIHEVMATKSKIFIVMEYAGGGDLLSKLLRHGGKLPEPKARRYFRQLVSALSFCHRNGIAHRDVKPQNLLLDKDGNLKVSDFGLSALPERLNDERLLHTACGTPAFAAPEVMARRGYDGARADAWSCGVILFVLLAGFLPFDDKNLAAMYGKIRCRDFKFPDWISKPTRSVIYKLLDPNPETRISLEAVKQTRWFQKNLEKPHQIEAFYSPEILAKVESGSINAFDIISFSSGLDLSGLFETRRRRGNRFTAAVPVAELVVKVGEIGEKLGYSVIERRGKGGGAAVGLMKEAVVVVVEAVEIPTASAAEAVVAETRVVEGEAGDEEWEELKKGLEEIVSSWHNDII